MSARGINSNTIEDSDTPDSRGQLVLSAIISEHFESGQPVGSKAVAERFANKAGLSSATIRNVMAELETYGLLEQPHTSAGRVPTDKGYRFYVDNLLGILSLSDDDLRIINRELGLGESIEDETPDKLMQRTSQVLSALSNNIGIVVSPSLAHDRLQHIEFVNLSDKRVLVVLVSAPSIVHNKVIRLTEAFKQDELDKTARYLNAEFGGKSLLTIRSEILRLMHEETALFDSLLQTAMILCSQSIEGEDETHGEVYVDGTANLLTRGDFADLDRLRGLIRTLEEKSRLVQILNECIAKDKSVSDRVQVVIGRENSADSLRDCAIITAPYRVGNDSAIGTLSVIGPTRIEYARMISVVSYLARMLETMMLKDSSDS
ncbi:MAG: heat-inducible transcription repressor HrcA [Aridibacter famidurans]|nr:heat-inducible transcription repressor HrcA [Aridibacter famidurans]